MRRVLVVDDDSSVRRVMAEMLAALGYTVVTAQHGLDAVDVFQSQGEQIDLVVTDLRMPVMDGYQAVELIRKAKPAVRIICMSSYLDQACPAGTTFLAKPFTLAEVQDCVGRVLAGP